MVWLNPVAGAKGAPQWLIDASSLALYRPMSAL